MSCGAPSQLFQTKGMMRKFRVDFAQNGGELEPFWQSTGFSPAELLLDDDMKQTLAYLGSVPHNGIRHVRIHYLLNLVTAEGLGTDTLKYDWRRLDEGLDGLVDNDLKPFFELMGNPSGYFTDFEDDAQLRAWQRLVRDLALHLIDRYGLGEVKTWYFETWNEPDIKFWKGSEQGFLNYYDACSEGLKEAHPSLRFGGPGSAHTLSPLFKRLLAHCDTGRNYFTGETGVRLDFISVHEKGAGKSDEDLRPNSAGITRREGAVVQYIREHHPRFADTPFMNNECDPQVGWQQIHTWRAKPYYAALICKIIYQHLDELIDGLGCRYEILSNDNGFMGTWGQRTQLTRFGERTLPAGQGEHKTRLEEAAAPQAFELVKKPALNVMTMLAFLGGRRCRVEGSDGNNDTLGVIASRWDDTQLAVLLFHSRDEIASVGTSQVTLEFDNLPYQDMLLAHYRLDEAHGNPFRVWEAMGDRRDLETAFARAPLTPTAAQLRELRAHQELPLLEPPREVQIDEGHLKLDIDLPLPSVSLLLLNQKPAERPGAPTRLRGVRYQGLTERENILLTWRGPGSRVLRTFEVLFATAPDGPFTRINDGDLIATAFLHAREPGQSGFYRVQAVDYWGWRSEPSALLEVR